MTVSLKDLKNSIKAHNSKAPEACYNDGYNEQNGLGTWGGRSFINTVLSDKYGLTGWIRITLADCKKYAHSIILSEVPDHRRELIDALRKF